MTRRENIHATAIVVDGKGLLIRGPSGAGKSLLALYLLDLYAARGREAALVADDRVDVERQGEGIVMAVPETIAGLIELRGRGILRRPYEPSARLCLVLDLVPELIRMPEEADFVTTVLGVSVPRCPVPASGIVGIEHQRLLIEAAFDAISIGPGA